MKKSEPTAASVLAEAATKNPGQCIVVIENNGSIDVGFHFRDKAMLLMMATHLKRVIEGVVFDAELKPGNQI